MLKNKSSSRTLSLGLLTIGLLTGVSGYALASQPLVMNDTAPVTDKVDFVADHMEYDDLNQVVTAFGNVEITQGQKIVRANKVTYNLTQEKVYAENNVVMVDQNGDTHFADKVELSRSMKDGYVKKLRSVLADGSRFSAEEGFRKDGNIIEMSEANYTPCEPCKADPSKAPAWGISATKARHIKDEHRIEYENATFDVMGVPIAYTPYFSHPDGTIKQKSGFLPPKFSLSSEQGFGALGRYYWAIDPSTDATFGIKAFTEQAPLGVAEFRKRFENALLELSGSVTYADRTDRINGTRVEQDEELRGHIQGKGILNIDEKWRAGFNTEWASDDQYLRQYDFSNEDVLENEIYAERFDDRDYAAVRAVAFQDVRVSDRQTDQPNILPEVEASFLGDPHEFFGGRWQLDMGALSLMREDDGQDVLRTSVEAGWQRRDVLSFGLVNTFNTSARADVYNVSDENPAILGAGTDEGGSLTRLYPIVSDTLSMPFERNFEGGTKAVIEPTAMLSWSPSLDDDSDIPNEDSQDVQIDAVNLFDANHFPGQDRVEDGTRATYGVRTGLYDLEGSHGEVFLGQSYRLSDKNNPFPEGSGLSDQQSDIVGQISGAYQGMMDLNYRFQIDPDDWRSERHELDGGFDLGALDFRSTYLYSNTLEGTDLTENREQLYANIGYQFTDEWHARTAARYDLGDSASLRFAEVGANYLGQCYTLDATARRNLTSDETGDASTEFLLSVGLKNLGEFGTGG